MIGLLKGLAREVAEDMAGGESNQRLWKRFIVLRFADGCYGLGANGRTMTVICKVRVRETTPY